MRAGRKRNWLAVAFAVALISVALNTVSAAAPNCPAPVPDHIPRAPSTPSPINIGTIQDLLLEYHQKYYDMDEGTLATIGRRAAVVELGPLQLRGFVGWLFWSVVHIYFLIGIRNRFIVALTWMWGCITFQGGARLITRVAPPSTPL